jgi:hypothetical protein
MLDFYFVSRNPEGPEGGSHSHFPPDLPSWINLGTRIIRTRIPGARVHLFAGSAVNSIVNNKNYDQGHQKRIKIVF